ncbi:nuclease-related domain-containing protein [Ferdinandcohnia sp. Marseille-Q9671]
MIYKSRTETADMLVSKSLYHRLDLSNKEKQYHSNLIKGYEGEVMFDTLTEKLECECLVLNDLLLQFNNTTFQIDSLLITSDVLYLFEVKNYEGDFYYDSDRLYTKTKIEINNPLVQMSRSESLLRQLLQSHGFTIPVQAFCIFINPAFTLYQAPLHKPFIFPTQLHAFCKNLNMLSAKLNKKHRALAEKLDFLHIENSPFRNYSAYEFEQLRKGILCESCKSFSIDVVGRKCICRDCGNEEMVVDAVKRSVEELKLVFPDMRITTNLVYEWCRVVESKKRIGRILDKHYKRIGVHQWSYYE